MSDKNKAVVENKAVEFPALLMKTGIEIAKSTMKGQSKTALLRADCILQNVDDRELIKAAYVAAGYTARDSRGSITNSDKFVAPALLVRTGKMPEKEFFALKTAEAADAFKRAGGAKGEGLNPEAWSEARRENAEEADKPKTGEARPPEGEEKNTPALSAYQILSAAISLRKGELNPNERALLVEQLLS